MSKPEDKPHPLKGRTGRNANAHKPVAEKLPEIVKVRCGAAEVKSWKAAARLAGQKVSAWIREALNAASGHSSDK